MSEEQNISENDQTHIAPAEPDSSATLETGLILEKAAPDSLNEPSMEVHKHPHHPTHKKNWREYFLEFFMIFLAVFLGFIAENVREHYVERHRAKEYAQSLYNDLKTDTASLMRAIRFKQWQNGNLDSLIILIYGKDPQSHARELYYYGCFANLPNLFFEPSDITIQQLRNSGSLRYFSSFQLYNIISQYYKLCAFYIGRENDITQLIPPLSLVSKIYSADQLRSMYNDDAPSADITKAIRWPPDNQQFNLIGLNSEAWNEYSLFVQRLRRRNGLPVGLLRLLEKNQKDIMAALKKEYDVD